MRTINIHKVPGKGGSYNGNAVVVLDEPGQGGACHHYQIRHDTKDPVEGDVLCEVKFQNGPIQEFGVNGVQQEDLLAIVIDRLSAFQAGPFANKYNAEALEYAQASLKALQNRTLDRIARNVEGYNKE